MNNLTQRILTGVVGAVVLIAGMLWNMYSLCITLFVIATFVHYEYIRTTSQLKDPLARFEVLFILIIGSLVYTTIIFSSAMLGFTGIFMFAVFPILIIMTLYELFAHRDHPFQNISMNVFGILYCVIPFAMLFNIPLLIQDLSYSTKEKLVPNYYFVLGYFFIVWTNDVMAYFIGKAIGKHKLFERISPKKTWEGFLGGFVFSIGMALCVSKYLVFLSVANWIIISIIIATFGTLGDLLESMLKRSLALKDSSNVLPGHGGFLDRFDATLVAAPIVWLYILLVLF